MVVARKIEHAPQYRHVEERQVARDDDRAIVARGAKSGHDSAEGALAANVVLDVPDPFPRELGDRDCANDDNVRGDCGQARYGLVEQS